MSLLTIAQAVAIKVGLSSPSIAASSRDQNILQIVGFINEEGQELCKRGTWQALTKEATFLTVATEAQGTVAALTGPDFQFIINETFWNRTQRRPVYGPKSAAEWQQLKAQFMQGPWIQYRLRGQTILFLPVPAAGQSCYFEWMSKYWCTDGTGATGKTSMTSDTDVAVLDETIIALGATWRMKAAKKLAYQEDQIKYEAAVEDALSREKTAVRLNLQGFQTDIYPAVVVPAGNWNT